MTRLYGGRLAAAGIVRPRKTAFLENYKAEVEAGHAQNVNHILVLCNEELKRPGRSRARRAFDAVILGVVAVPVLVGSLLEIVLAERARSRARDRHSEKRKNAK